MIEGIRGELSQELNFEKRFSIRQESLEPKLAEVKCESNMLLSTLLSRYTRNLTKQVMRHAKNQFHSLRENKENEEFVLASSIMNQKQVWSPENSRSPHRYFIVITVFIICVTVWPKEKIFIASRFSINFTRN